MKNQIRNQNIQRLSATADRDDTAGNSAVCRKSAESGGLMKLLAAMLVLLMILCGCAGGSGGETRNQDGGNGEKESSCSYRNYLDFSAEKIQNPVIGSEGSEKIVKDCSDRKVRIPDQPERIAVLDSFSGEVVVMIGAGERMVTCPNGVKSDLLLQQIDPALSGTEVVMSGGAFNAEALLALKPDLIFIKSDLYTSEEERAKLERLGIPYLVISYSNMKEQIYALSLIGNAVGGEAAEKAEQIKNYYCDTVRKSAKIAETIPDQDRCRVYHSINEAVRTDGEESLGNDWISCVGAADVSAEHTEAMQQDGVDYCAGIEQIFEWDPDLVICNEADTRDYLLSNEKWSGLRAVSENRVLNIPVGATRWGQRGSAETYFAMIWLGTQIYPEAYAGYDLRQEVETLYRDVLGMELDDETWNQILSGSGIRNSSGQSGA